METLELLGVALGLATLAGVNLYLTVFVTGLAVRMEWISLHPPYEQLAILGDPVILWVSGALFLLEFFADKVPWVDSLWDSVHTLIRPVGAALLAITVLGDVNPVYDVLVGLLSGGMALGAHAAKTGTRLMANASPEPFSNIGLSLAEDVGVIAGFGLIAANPVLALVLAVVLFGLALWLLPRLFRSAKIGLWFLWHRMAHAFGRQPEPASAEFLPHELDAALARARGGQVQCLWAAPCVSDKLPGVRRNHFGWLLFSTGDRGGLDFARKAAGAPQVVSIDLAQTKVQHRRGFLSDRVVIYHATEGHAHAFRFDRTRRDQAASLVRLLSGQAAPVPAAS